MARYSATVRSSGSESTTLPHASLYAATSVQAVLREVHVYNTTATSVALKLSRLDTAGTRPAAVTDAQYNQSANAASCSVAGTHTAGPTIDEDITRFMLGAAIGSGVILTFGEDGVRIPAGTANGIGVVLSTGTTQICDITFVWDE